MRNGVLRLALRPEGRSAVASVRQLPDGALEAKLSSEGSKSAALDALRFALAVDVDHSEFLRMAGSDRVLGPLLTRLRGFRPMRLGTPAQSIASALAGQLVTGGEAARVHRALVRACAAERAGLRLPPTAGELAGLSPAVARRCGLATRRAAALGRLSSTFDVSKLAGIDAEAAVRRISRERQLGPWSAGVVMLYGLGRYEQGLVGDLGLVRMRSSQLGRRATAEETVDLLRPYGHWAGLASAYLLRHPLAKQKGPIPDVRRSRRVRRAA
jgi:DNA-3-methyladenine glycosylase II